MKIQLPPTIRAVFTDMDGTLTQDDGTIAPSTFEALARLREQGFWVVIVTGRPAGWADCMVRLWPVDAVIFENGAGFFTRNPEGVECAPLAEAENSADKRARLFGFFEAIRAKVPHARLAADQPYRRFDVAIDLAEEKPHLTASEVNVALEVLRAQQGVVAKVSSAHINFLFGNHTKRTAIEALLSYEKVRCVAANEVVFIGDSLNDEPCFEFLAHCVGVANISSCWELLKSRPKQVTKSRGGNGFEEVAYCLLTR